MEIQSTLGSETLMEIPITLLLLVWFLCLVIPVS
jgi:hypothetical protein